jgi:ADP-ribose pyrophosphatase YjhB (NUDIX family)
MVLFAVAGECSFVVPWRNECMEKQPEPKSCWMVKDQFLELRSRWLTLIGEHLQDSQGNLLEYWRVEKADSVVVLPIAGDRLWLPRPSYRPGLGTATLDFPGGRVVPDQSPEQAAIATLQRELGIEAALVTRLSLLSPQGWPINSSFSNQKLYGFVAYLESAALTQLESFAETYPATQEGLKILLDRLLCLQCRSVLLTWWWQYTKAAPQR